MKKASRIILIIIGILLIIAMGALIFLRTAPVFGTFSDKEYQRTLENRAVNYYDNSFHNEVELPNSEIDESDPYKDRTTGKGTYPKEDLPVVEPSFGNCPAGDVEITWYGHTTFLINMHGMNILIDPVFSDYLGLNKLLGSPRFEKIHSYAEKLPHIDLCILTHDHFDHLDYQALKELDDRIDAYLTPLGVNKRLERFGISADRISDIAWWEEIEVDGLHIACTPAQHTSGRIVLDKRQTLWCSYVFYDDDHKIFLTGDTGFGPHFEEIHDAYGDIDLMLTDGAQYGEEKDKHTNHMFPEESAQAASIMKAKKVMIIHWGSFCLSDWHSWDDPPTRFSIACEELDLDNITPMIGQTFLLSNTNELHEHWWEELE